LPVFYGWQPDAEKSSENISRVLILPVISVIVPIFNEEANLQPLVDQLLEALLSAACPFELIIVDDGSTDSTPNLLADLSQGNAAIRPLWLARNYGQSAALQAGFDAASGDFVVTLDGDLQNDPQDIPAMIDVLRSNPSIDVVSGWRKNRQDAALSRRLPSAIANKMISIVTKVRLHDYGCALKAYRAHVIKNIHLYGELHRFIPALAAESGARVVEMPVRHHPRSAGVSKYGIDRTLRVLLDLLWIRFTMRFLHRPMHAFGGVAAVMLLAGLGILAWLALEKLLMNESIGGRPLLLLGALLVLIGTQLLAVGLLGELLTRIYHEPQGRRQYILRSHATRPQAKPS
jgi:glycosyltransferase involved in cell wall biosynthesis